MKSVLVLCTGNSCRSQMAEGYLRHLAGDGFAIFSAGLDTHGVNPKAVHVMQEDNIDISGHTSNNISEYGHLTFDYVITVCDNAREQCPFFPAKTQMIHHSFRDPASATGSDAEVLQEFRSVRDLIRDFCRDFIASLR